MLTGCLAARPEFRSAGWWGPTGRQPSRRKGSVESEDPELLALLSACSSSPLPCTLSCPLPSPTVTRALNDSFLNEGCGGGKQWKERPNSRSWGNDNLGRIEVSSRNSWCNQPMVPWFIHGAAYSLASLLPSFPPLYAGTSKVISAFCPLCCTSRSLGAP